MTNRITQTWKNLNQASPETLGGIRNGLFLAILADLFVFWWYLELKRLSLALFIVIIIFLALILLIERRQSNKMMDVLGLDEDEFEEGDEGEDEEEDEVEEEVAPKKKKKVKKKRAAVSEPQESGFGLDIGLPSAKEFEERANRAIGPGFCFF